MQLVMTLGFLVAASIVGNLLLLSIRYFSNCIRDSSIGKLDVKLFFFPQADGAVRLPPAGGQHALQHHGVGHHHLGRRHASRHAANCRRLQQLPLKRTEIVSP